jgi:hypothetical protein
MRGFWGGTLERSRAPASDFILILEDQEKKQWEMIPAEARVFVPKYGRGAGNGE